MSISILPALLDAAASLPSLLGADRLREAVIDPDVSRAIDSLPNRVNEFGFDPWGFHPESAKVYFSIARRFVYSYFHPEIIGIENVPAGRVLIVPNHSGQLPFDGMVIAMACLLLAKPPRLVRAQAERWVPTLPFVNEAFSRSGVVVGDPINCRNLLLEENAILVFPEGAGGSGKEWKDRYRLRRFPRGFMRLALQTGAPIVPVAVVGAEESMISLYNWRSAAKLLKMPYVPISPLYFPLPTKFHVRFGEPMQFEGPFDDEDPIIDAKAKQVQDRVQEMIDALRAARTSIF